MSAQVWRRLLITGIGMSLVGYIVLVASFWLPFSVGGSLQNTAGCLLVPGLFGTLMLLMFRGEMVHQTVTPLRCSDCGTKILNPGGTTVGDQIEGELMGWFQPVRGEVDG